MAEALLQIINLKKHYNVAGGFLRREKRKVRAVDGVSFAVYRGESFGLVGESGSGKTTLGKTILRLIEPTSGQIFLEGEDLCALSEEQLRRERAEMQMVFQDPYTSLNPRQSVKKIVAEPLAIHHWGTPHQIENRVRDLIHLVGLQDEHLYRFPHEFSGGQRQRIGIARALAMEPKLLILDEPTSALDVSVQAEILNMLHELQQRLNLTYIFISHDLSVIQYMCDRVGVMYLGRIVEQAAVDQIFEAPKHPYTQALLSAIPEPNPEHAGTEIVLRGELSQAAAGRGCPFAPRCWAQQIDACVEIEPPLLDLDDAHQVACHLWHAGLGDRADARLIQPSNEAPGDTQHRIEDRMVL